MTGIKAPKSLWKTIAGVTTALTLAGSVWATEPVSTLIEPGDGKPNLFEISDGNSSIFLFGTVHVLKPETDWQRPLIKEKIASADRIFFELDQDDPQFQMIMQTEMQKRMMNTSDQKLTEALTVEENATLAELVAPLGIPPQMVDGLDPWVIFLNINIAGIMQAGFNPNSGVESALSPMVQEAGKDIEGLESASFQLDVFDTLPFDEQVTLIKSYIEDRSEMPEMLNSMISLWQDDKWEELADLINEGTSQSPTLSYKLFEERNRNWVVTFKELLAKDETAFIAVGAGHLPGDLGVISLMEEAGYTVKQY